MAKNGFKIMDCDMHVFEPADMWQRYIDPKFVDRAPVGTGETATTLEGKDLMGVPLIDIPGAEAHRTRQLREREVTYQVYRERNWDPTSQLLAMDREGLDLAVLFPTRGLYTHSVDGMDPELADAIGRAYDNWMHDFCQTDPKRFYGAAHVSPHDMESAVREARRCVEELGFRCVFLRSNIANGRNWHDPFYDPLWAECERLGVPVAFHGAGNPPQMSDAAKVADHFETLMLQHIAYHPIPQMLNVISFCAAGILARFPRLRVAFLEGNASWVPWLMYRMDEKYEWLGYESPDLEMPPSEYFKRQCYVSMDGDEWPAKYVEDAGFVDNLVISTDYPHADARFPRVVDTFFEQGFSDEFKRKVLWDNCARLYGFE